MKETLIVILALVTVAIAFFIWGMRSIDEDEVRRVYDADPVPSPERTLAEYEKDSFIQSCVREGGDLKYCSCVIDYLEDHYTYDEILSLGDDISSGSMPEPLYDAAGFCYGKRI